METEPAIAASLKQIAEKLASRIQSWKQTGYRRAPMAEAIDYVEFVSTELRFKGHEASNFTIGGSKLYNEGDESLRKDEASVDALADGLSPSPTTYGSGAGALKSSSASPAYRGDNPAAPTTQNKDEQPDCCESYAARVGRAMGEDLRRKACQKDADDLAYGFCLESKAKLADALRLVLPMAKGYASANRVGLNQKYIEIAEAALGLTEKSHAQSDSTGSPVKYADGSYSREYEEQSTAPALDDKELLHLACKAFEAHQPKEWHYVEDGIQAVIDAVRPHVCHSERRNSKSVEFDTFEKTVGKSSGYPAENQLPGNSGEFDRRNNAYLKACEAWFAEGNHANPKRLRQACDAYHEALVNHDQREISDVIDEKKLRDEIAMACLLEDRKSYDECEKEGIDPIGAGLVAYIDNAILPTIRPYLRTPRALESIARAIHYPRCWDTAAYPTIDDALLELAGCVGCSECKYPGENPDADQKPIKPVSVSLDNCLLAYIIVIGKE